MAIFNSYVKLPEGKHSILGFSKPLRGYYDQCEPSNMSEQDSNITFQFLARVKLLNIAFWSIHQYRLSWYAQFCLQSWWFHQLCRSCNGIWTSIPYWNDVPLQGPQHSFNNTMAHCHSPAALQALMAELNVTWTAPKGSKGASAPWGNPPWKVNMSFQKPSTWWKSCLLMGVAFMLGWC